MKRVNLYIDEVMLGHLRRLPGTVSGNAREAIYEYLKRNSDAFKVSSSASKKAGDKNG